MQLSHQLSHISIYHTIFGVTAEEKAAADGTAIWFSYDDDYCYRYNISYDEDKQKMYCVKTIFDTATEVKLYEYTYPDPDYSRRDLSQMSYFVYTIMVGILGTNPLYFSYTDMLSGVVLDVKRGRISAQTKMIQDLIELYPESFL